MIILDLSSILVATLMQNLKMSKNEFSKEYLRYMVLNSIRANFMRFKYTEGKLLVLACDGAHTWRRDAFPFYKQTRRNSRDASGLDWPAYHQFFAELIEELRDNFHYPVIKHDKAEADDIIGTLVHHYHDKVESILIISGDQDFLQLQKYPNVKQWAPVKKMFLEKTEDQYLIDHILEGDSADGIPNVLSDDDTFIIAGKRQHRLIGKIKDHIKQQMVIRKYPITVDRKETIDDVSTNVKVNIQANIRRNRTLIDLSMTPHDIRDSIIEQYEHQVSTKEASSRNLINYMINNNLKLLTECVGDFV